TVWVYATPSATVSETLKYPTAQPRVSASSASSLLDCYSPERGLPQPSAPIHRNQLPLIAKTRINTGQNTLSDIALILTCRLISTVFHRPCSPPIAGKTSGRIHHNHFGFNSLHWTSISPFLLPTGPNVTWQIPPAGKSQTFHSFAHFSLMTEHPPDQPQNLRCHQPADRSTHPEVLILGVRSSHNAPIVRQHHDTHQDRHSKHAGQYLRNEQRPHRVDMEEIRDGCYQHRD